MTEKKDRLHVVDALRGFAILAIMLLHNIEHFDVYIFPDDLPLWMQTSDQVIWDTLFFLFGGKVYPMFALLFGLTFFIQSDNQKKRGQDFSWRFVWRMLLLLFFGLINSAFYQGDILTIYAVLGVLLIPLNKLGDRAILILAIILFLQPVHLLALIQALQDPLMPLPDPESWTYFGKIKEYIGGDSIMETIKGNLTNGKRAVILWNWENGRFTHIVSLFLFGLLAGRKRLFASTDGSKIFWKKSLKASAMVFVVLYTIQLNLESWVQSKAVLRPLEIIEKSWTNLSFMLFLVSGFYLVFQTQKGRSILKTLSPIGKMSLSNYVFQSILGSWIYYGFGLGLYLYTGATYGVLIGIILCVIVVKLCGWWAKKYAHGPLEGIWHKLTWMGSKK